ncbi:MAG: hypothetical protein AB8G77_10215 [Rhodothermales bacterium]
MIQKDFVLRQIQQLVQVMARVLQLKTEGFFEEAADELDIALNETLDTSVKELLTMTEEEILLLCTRDGQLNADIALVLAELLEETDELAVDHALSFENEQHNQEKGARGALFLYKALVSSGKAVPFDIYDRISRLEANA